MLSKHFQVLCDDTAIIGVLKQKNKNTGEMEMEGFNLDKGRLGQMYEARVHNKNAGADNNANAPNFDFDYEDGRGGGDVTAEDFFTHLFEEDFFEENILPKLESACNEKWLQKFDKTWDPEGDGFPRDADEGMAWLTDYLCDEDALEEHLKLMKPLIGVLLSGFADQPEPEIEHFPNFNETVEVQSTNGAWSTIKAMKVLKRCFADRKIEDAGVRAEVNKPGVKQVAAKNNKHTADSVYQTLVALYVLMTIYHEDTEEWKLIGKKAVAFLIQNGIEKPRKLAAKFTQLTIRKED